MAEYYSTKKYTDLERLLSKVEVLPTGCWLWIGARNKGYGTFFYKGKVSKAHRASYMIHVGPIPEGKDIDHKCHDPKQCVGGFSCPHRRCVNPDHLEPVTRQYNCSPERCNHKAVAFDERLEDDPSKSTMPIIGRRKKPKKPRIYVPKTHCPQGHEYTPENTYYSNNKWPYCVTCNKGHKMKKKSTVMSRQKNVSRS